MTTLQGYLYTTREGDVLDEICQTVYGYTRGSTEQVLAANPILRDYGDILPVGVNLILPDITPPRETEIFRIWE